MTEAEWLACSDPQTMLDFLRGKVSEPKLRLFAVACCRAAFSLLLQKSTSKVNANPPLLLDHERRIAELAEAEIQVAEDYIDGPAQRRELIAAYCHIISLLSMRRPVHESWAFALVAVLRAVSGGDCYYGQEWELAVYDSWQCGRDAAEYVTRVGTWAETRNAGFGSMPLLIVRLLHCMFGSSLFHSVAADSTWLTPNVVTLAQAIFDERAFDRMPILADALEDAGCTNQEILAHCRGPGPHVRGCWALDLLLGKE